MDVDDSLTLAQVFEYDKPFSHCVLGSLQRLLPSHSSNQRLVAIEVAADILKNGRGESVQKFRRAGIDEVAVARLVQHANQIASNLPMIGVPIVTEQKWALSIQNPLLQYLAALFETEHYQKGTPS